MDPNNFLLFAFASLMLNLTPGSDMLYVVTRSTGQGVLAGVVSAFGIAAGCFVHVFASVIGLSALLAQSAVAFTLLQYAGAVYLIYLGARAMLGKGGSFDVSQESTRIPVKKIFWQGAITNALNPKVALFFLAFLPQFVTPGSADASYYFLMLGIWFNISGTVVNVLVAIAFGKMGKLLTSRTWFANGQQKFTGLVLILLGLKIALTKK